jgi:hypothetical protein
MQAREAYFLRGRFPFATVCIETVLIFAAIGLIGYALLPVIGY